MTRKIITVFGPSGGTGVARGSAAYQEAQRLGRLLAEAGFTLCNGGYSGTMEAAARGAREAGGHTIGVTLALFDPASANSYIVEERKARDFFARLRRLITLADGIVCLRGGIGTLTEFHLTWTLLQTRALPRRPLLCVGPEWQGMLDAYARHTLVRPKDLHLITWVPTIEAAVADLRSRLL